MSGATPRTERLDRIVAAVMGTLFVGLAGAIVHWATLTTGVAFLVLVLGALGLEAIVSAVRGRRCLLSRIGPLP